MANFDIASFNLINWANSVADLYDSTPKDVKIIQKDNNGNLFTKNIANRGMFKQQLWDDVGSALGQFNRTFYVDADNGDDNNNGDSDHPFKTIQKACNSVPIGGVGTIKLKEGQQHDMSADIKVYNKELYFRKNGDDTPTVFFKAKKYGNSASFYQFSLYQAILEFVDIDITADNDDAGGDASSYPSYLINANYSAVVISGSTVDLGTRQYTRILQSAWNGAKNSFEFSVYSTKIILDSTENQTIARLDTYQTHGLAKIMWNNSSLKNRDDDDLKLQDYVTGVLTNSDNHYPLNVLSNIDFGS